MSRAPSALRPVALLLTVLLAAFALMLTSQPLVSAAAVVEDDVTQTAEPSSGDDASQTVEPEPVLEGSAGSDDPAVTQTPSAAPAAEDFQVDYIGPDCLDSSYNVWVEYNGDPADLRLVLQEDVDGTWVTLQTQRFSEGGAGVFSDTLAERETRTFRTAVYDVRSADELTVLHGPEAVTGVAMDECLEPLLPEERWTLAEAGCGTVTFTSRTDEDVAVVWMGVDDPDLGENFFFLAPGQTHTIETTQEHIFWVSAVGVDDNLEPIDGEFFLAGDGEVEVEQDCAPATPAPPAGGGHQVPDKVQTDGGADTLLVSLGMGLMGLAGLGLRRRTS